MRIIDNILDVESLISSVDGVIFDLDDTLYSEKEYVRSGYNAIAKHYGMPELELQLWNVFEQGGKAIDVVFEFNNMIQFKEEALKIYRYHEPHIYLYPGVIEMLENIKKIKKIGIITDGRPEGQRAKINALSLSVDEIIVTDELGGVEYRKPNELAFRIMQSRFNVPFEKMVYIGDNINKDFIAPEKLKMETIWFKNNDGIYIR